MRQWPDDLDVPEGSLTGRELLDGALLFLVLIVLLAIVGGIEAA